MNAQESQIGGGEIVRKMQVIIAWHPKRCELLAVYAKKKSTDKFAPSISIHLQKKTAFGEANGRGSSRSILPPSPDDPLCSTGHG
jgi:hypothetical protein